MSRPLRPAERALVERLLQSHAGVNWPNAPEVEEMKDGGMGSLRFLSSHSDRRHGSTLAEAEFYDEDGAVVLTALYLDNFGDLYELDIWRTDFRPLIQIPPPERIRLKTTGP